jgi:hypothetical protein
MGDLLLIPIESLGCAFMRRKPACGKVPNIADFTGFALWQQMFAARLGNCPLNWNKNRSKSAARTNGAA